MFNWLCKLRSKDKEAIELLQKAHEKNAVIVEQSQARAEKTAKQADKALQQVYDISRKLDVAEKIYIATGQHK